MDTKFIMNYYSNGSVGNWAFLIICWALILFFIVMSIIGKIKFRIDQKKKRAEEFEYRRQLIYQNERQVYEDKIRKEREEREEKEKKIRDENINRIYEKKRKDQEIKKEIQRLDDIETQNNILYFFDFSNLNQSYKIDYESTNNSTGIVLKKTNLRCTVPIKWFANLFIVEQHQDLNDIEFVDEFRRSEFFQTIRSSLLRKNFELDESFTITAVKKLRIRNEFVTTPNVPIYRKSRYSMYKYFNEQSSKVRLQKPVDWRSEYNKIFKVLYSSEVIEGTNDKHIQGVPVFVISSK